MSTDPNRVKSIFLGAAEQPDGAARVAYLDRACGDDAALRGRVEALLRSHDPDDSFLGTPAAVIPDLGHAGTLAFDSTDRDGDLPGRDPKDADERSFLAPPTRPGSLGRIGHYEVLEVLGRGGFGIVFRAFDEVLQRVVAVKVMAPQIATLSPARRRFLREARSSAAVRHENVVQVYEVGEQPLPYLVMEFIPGETLQKRLERCGPLDLGEVLRIGRQIAEGLAAAHASDLIHRDIKPGNILLEGGTQKVKITDFGLARAADDASISQIGVVAGTPMFMAPEQALGGKIDHRADLFSLGSVLYVMCTGRPPFRANSTLAVLKRVAEEAPRPIPEIIADVPRWLCDLIARLHAKRPEDRIGTAREVADLLAQGLAALPQPKPVLSLPVVAPTGEEAAPQEGRVPAGRAAKRERAPALPSRPRIRRRLAAAGVLLLLFGGLGFTEATGITEFHGTVIRLFSPQGTLVVEVDDPAVSVKIDGPDIVIKGAGASEIRLKPGDYTVEARRDGQVVRRELVSVTTNGRRVVRVSQVPADVKDPGPPSDRAAWERAVAALPADVQLAVVVAKLKERNPGYDGQVEHAIKDGVVTELHLGGPTMDNVRDLSPLRALTGLKSFGCGFSRQLSDLSPLKETKLTEVTVQLSLVKDLSPLKDLKLTKLHLYVAPVSDLSPLKGNRTLTSLCINMTSVSDLSPLKGVPLTVLDCGRTGVTDLSPLRGMKLTFLRCGDGPAVTDLSPLKGMPLTELDCSGSQVSDLSPLKGMPLKTLSIFATGVTDLTPLRDLPLEDVRLTPKNITKGLDVLRGMKGVKTIGINSGDCWPAAEFWARYDKGEFAK